MSKMIKVTDKLLNWASIIEEGALEQAKVTSSMPFVTPHLALMPDAHFGKGSTVGSVVPTHGAIMPACVGVDIGCGMMAVKTSLKSDHVFDRKGTRESIESQIPLSAGKQNREIKLDAEGFIYELSDLATTGRFGFNPSDYTPNWKHQLGTLGSGNHFIEISVDEEENIWLFLHSGSRGVGNKIATRHIKVAQEFCKKNFIQLPDPDLAYLVEGTDGFDSYIKEMRWAQEYAFLNRVVMMSRVKAAITHWAGGFESLEEINCHHNFTQQEHHMNQNLWITRKGAISAKVGEMGLIPGSMGAASYVVEGLGHPASFDSAPHGAGRQYGRNVARKTFTMESLTQSMEGIEWNHSEAFLDEHPNAYKDIDVVMNDASNLVKIKHTLHQIINVKGD
jgi:tRNA-splicing ligase RtcB